jgi:hypothetical protein
MNPTPETPQNSVTLDSRLYQVGVNIAIARSRLMVALSNPASFATDGQLNRTVQHLQAALRALANLIGEVDGIRLDRCAEYEEVRQEES